MNTYKNQGFTIIELTLFVAISTLLLVIGFNAVSGRTEDIQFTDSIRTIEAQLNSDLANVGTGLNLRGDYDCELSGSRLEFGSNPSAPEIGTNRNCVANGTYVSFGPEGQYLTQAVATDAALDDDESPLDNLLLKLGSGGTALVTGTNQDVNYRWQVRYVGGYEYDGSDTTGVESLSFLKLRTVNSSSEYMFADTASGNNLARFNEPLPEDYEYGLCFLDEDDRSAAITVDGDGRFAADFSSDEERCRDLVVEVEDTPVDLSSGSG